MIKFVLKRILKANGYSLRRNDLTIVEPGSMLAGLQRIKNLTIAPAIVIDLGAAAGTWTTTALSVWPDAGYHLIEPLEEQVGSLNALQAAHPNIHYHLAVAGEAAGRTWLNVSPDLDGSGVYGAPSDNTREVPVVTIDDIVKDLPGNILIKFDTHGYEVPILKGSMEALKRTSALVIEVYGFKLSPTCLVFHELSAYLDTLGFRLADIVDMMRRPGDQLFWQADAVYLRKDNPAFDNASYQ